MEFSGELLTFITSILATCCAAIHQEGLTMVQPFEFAPSITSKISVVKRYCGDQMHQIP